MDTIAPYIDALNQIFKTARDKHEANYRSQAVLQDFSGDAAFFTQILEKHLRTPQSLDTRHYPVVSFEVESNPYYTLLVNCWIPLPGREVNISTKSIHHHGNMLLSTVTGFGPGYEHWTFTRPELLDPDSELYDMKLIERAPHPRHHIAFVDSYVAHLPFYPPELSVTYALWSNQFPVTWIDHVKRVPLMKKNAAALRRVAVRAGLASQLDLKVVEYFDFYPTPEGFRGIRQRSEFERGPNEDYLYSLFHVIQRTGNDAVARLIEEQLRGNSPPENATLIQQLLGELRQGNPIDGKLSSMHYGFPRANFTPNDIENALAAQTAAPLQSAAV